MRAPQRHRIGSLPVDGGLSAAEFALYIIECVEAAKDDTSALVVATPNVQHLATTRSSRDFTSVLENHELLLPDGWPVAWLVSRVSGVKQERVTGSDIVPELLRLAQARAFSVGFVGGSDAAVKTAGARVRAEYSGLEVVESVRNPLIPECPTPESIRAVAGVLDRPIDLLFFCFGAPKSERHAQVVKDSVPAKAILCVGATVDFLAGTASRAPAWMRRSKLEWAYRLVKEPKRLWKRYLYGGIAFLLTVATIRPHRQG